MAGQRKRKSRGAQSALLVVAVLLAGSAGLRLGSGTGLAIAREVEELAGRDARDAPRPSGHLVETCTPPPDIAATLIAFQTRDAALSKAEATLAERRQSLRLIEAEVTAKLAELESAEARLRETLALADGAAEQDLARLTAVYENMKAKDAAKLFQEMSPDFAAGFLGRMRPDAAAAVMAGMSPDAAYSVSVFLAGRNARVPRE